MTTAGALSQAEPLDAWLDREYRYAATAMLRSVSPVDIIKERPGFGQRILPVKGAIVASPVLASYDPDPDYFFHWYRDSAVVIDALRLLFEHGELGQQALEHVADFTRFSLSLAHLDGRALVSAPAWRSAVTAGFVQYVRDDEDFAAVLGDAIAGDTRVNPDGTLDISRWNRPQHDGPPLRALALLQWVRKSSLPESVVAEVSLLIRADLAFTFQRWRTPSYDIWEEESGHHYYTLCVAAAALAEGSKWLRAGGDEALARAYGAESIVIHHRLDEFWLEEAGHYRSRVLSSGERSTKELDIAVVLAAIHVAQDHPREPGTSGISPDDSAHTVHDPRMQSTLARLEALFDSLYPINHGRPAERGPAMGRYAGDVYYSGGAYYFSTLGAAELCFRAAVGSKDASSWVRRGDAYLETVRTYTPVNGELSEQFDQRTGVQSSARHLAWSYAALISAVAARRAALASRAATGTRQ